MREPTAFHFYPRSPCGERRFRYFYIIKITQFLSTLSLRRATARILLDLTFHENFYPRSPCGERPRKSQSSGAGIRISIHALLAESDNVHLGTRQPCVISIHALLAESDQQRSGKRLRMPKFLSTLSLRRATNLDRFVAYLSDISIHALLAESDMTTLIYASSITYFYPRSPCGERR